MPTETVIWLAVNLLVGLLTLLAALFVTRTPEMAEATDNPPPEDRSDSGSRTDGDEPKVDSTGDSGDNEPS